MTEKTYRLMWGICLLIIGLGAVLNAADNIFGGFLPDIAVRIIGIVDLIAIPIFVFSAVKLKNGGSKNSK